VLIRYLWQLKTVVFQHWCPICAVLLLKAVTCFELTFVVEGDTEKVHKIYTADS